MIIKNLIPELDEEQIQRLEENIDLKNFNSRFSEGLHLLESNKIDLGVFGDVVGVDLSTEPFMFYKLFIALMGPVSQKIIQCVSRQIYIDAEDASRIAEQLINELVKRLSNFYLRPSVAHIKQVSAQGLLQGETPEERYENYCRRWSEDFRGDFYARYPLLQHVHVTIMDQFYVAVSEIFERVQAHESDIRKLLDITDAAPLKLESLVLAGDHHNGGRTGCVLVFRQGTVVYKPRSVEGEQAYYNIIQKLAAHGAPAMRAARVAVGNGYGFMEFIEREEVDFSSEDFLEYSGRLAAILYALQGKDMHEENLIPLAEGPVPVDLETMLHPVHIAAIDDPEIPDDSAFLRKIRGISTSALLPTRLMRSDPSQGYVDIGFIQGEQGVNPFAGMGVERPFRDDAVVRFVRESASKDTSNTSETEPSELERQRNLQAARASSFASGFTQMYRWICEERQTILEVIRAECTGITLRVVVQPTMYYGQLLRMLGSPEALASEDVFITIALRVAAFGANRPLEVITEEAKTLLDLNIPFFVQHTDCAEVVTLEGKKVGLKTKVSTLEEVLHHLEELSEDDLAEQIDQIWSAFVSPYPADALADGVKELLQDEQSLQDKRIFRGWIADRLVAGLHPGGAEEAPHTLVAPTPGTQQQHTGGWDTAVLNSDFYSGYTGVAMALAQIAGEQCGNENYVAAVYSILTPVMDSIFSDNTSLMVPEEARDTTFYGEPGIAFALAGAAEYLDDPRLKEAATVLGNRVAERLAQAEHPSPDYLTGQVGAAALMLGYDLADDREALLGVLDRHAQDIIDGRVEEEWWSHSGFAHGISASIFALSRWSRQMPSEERARHAVKILLDRLREFDNGESWESQISGQGSRGGVWCHGTAGISLALAAVQVWMPELSTRADLERAVHHALYEGTGRNLTYCHGDLGTLDILEWVVNHVPDLPDAEKIRDILTNGYSTSLLQKTLDDKSVRYSLTPSYMVGTSGVLSWLTRRIGGTRLYTPIIPDSTEA